MSRRTTASSSDEQLPATEVLPALSTGADDAPVARRARRQPPGGLRRPTLYVGVAAAGAILVNVLVGGEPGTRAEAAVEPASVVAQLDLSSQQTGTALVDGPLADRLGQLAANRSEREAAQAAAAQAQAAADQAVLDAQAAAAAQAAAEAQAAEEARIAAEAQAAAEAKAAEEAAAAAARAATPAPSSTTRAPAAPAPVASSGSGSFQDYALGKLGGDQTEFSCLESLWGKESGWNPNAQNPNSTAYGIPQFLDSTWKSTGIAKTADGYRQIDAGLIYITNRYGSPCAAWSHSKATGWY
ncbi:transglycosylase SLT domain-containing protein [Modestobacter sp. VKM Ac-2983]|uniref:aggregation-promoting factor C-terminal-like domain-containing protein n=1 Tax=Modestobacter sp. VKM Ac-2983 TaxID=3004137 RepID=UPI0022AB5EA8|nr:transglycosylase SLT domain-containing protein [Modestobacter sp. VKM Ac-2983]MCZ2805293.1 transglycosylase SLT domain-containing protein [Modestobacter sp. VKM Ac-2983]